MLTFIVFRNGTRLTTAGISGFGVVTTILSWVRREGDATQDRPELDLNVGGLEGNHHLDWAKADLQAGDVITIELREQGIVDEPMRRSFEEAGTDDVSILKDKIEQMESHLAELRVELALREKGQGREP